MRFIPAGPRLWYPYGVIVGHHVLGRLELVSKVLFDKGVTLSNGFKDHAGRGGALQVLSHHMIKITPYPGSQVLKWERYRIGIPAVIFGPGLFVGNIALPFFERFDHVGKVLGSILQLTLGCHIANPPEGLADLSAKRAERIHSRFLLDHYRRPNFTLKVHLV